MTRQCQARGCEKECPRPMLMCKHHWAMVSKATKAKVWAAYRGGQGYEMDEYRTVANCAIKETAEWEHQNRVISTRNLHGERIALQDSTGREGVT